MITFVQGLGKPLLFGSTALTKRAVGRGVAWSPLNRSLLLAPSGRLEAQYDKIDARAVRRVRAAVPLPSSCDKIVPSVGDFVPGSGPTLFALRDTHFAVLICYEGIFPGLTRRFVARGADFLVNITNDAWFGDSRAPYQHLAMATVRAIENRVAAGPRREHRNLGGRTPRRRHRIDDPLGTRGVRIAEVGTDRRASTFYTRHGDLFVKAAVLAAALMLVYAGWTIPGPQPAAVGAA